MVIQHNMSAMGATRYLGIVVNNQSKKIEKLSSGYRINRAADDAAGLAISEKMRRQIRGLAKGSENIQDGISLVQTAEGAMNELTDMIHRIRELSIQALNDTNTKTDREYIQREISQLTEEFDHIPEITTFNEIYVLKGNPTVSKTYLKESSILKTHKEIITRSPDWLIKNSSEELKEGTLTGTQDVSKYCYDAGIDDRGRIDKDKSYYYGPKPNDPAEIRNEYYKWGGKEWTPSLDNNLSAKIDFGELASITDADTLFNELFKLGGASFNIPCSTCDDEYMGVSYSVDMPDYTIIPKSAQNSSGKEVKNSGNLDITSYLLEIDKLKTDSKELGISPSTTDVQNLAKKIAKELRDKSLAIMKKDNNHFDIAREEGEYAIGVYDYRDMDIISPTTTPKINYSVSCTEIVRGPDKEMIWTTEESSPDLRIVCSANIPDYIDFGLPSVSSSLLGISNYRVDEYDIFEIEEYTTSYNQKLDDYDKLYEQYEKDLHLYNTDISESYIDVPYNSTRTEFYYAKGELKRKEVPVTGYRQEKVVVHNRSKPTEPVKPDPSGNVTGSRTEYVYKPPDLNILDDALHRILEMRSDLGAVQNRLEHAYNNNQNKEENLTASESRLRDTDMNTTFVAFSNNQILIQVGQAILAQANQSRNGVLALIS